jgi:hypothetical protein
MTTYFTFQACMFVVSQIGKFCLLCSNERVQFYLFETSFQVSHLHEGHGSQAHLEHQNLRFVTSTYSENHK